MINTISFSCRKECTICKDINSELKYARLYCNCENEQSHMPIYKEITG